MNSRIILGGDLKDMSSDELSVLRFNFIRLILNKNAPDHLVKSIGVDSKGYISKLAFNNDGLFMCIEYVKAIKSQNKNVNLLHQSPVKVYFIEIKSITIIDNNKDKC